jgi:dTDP-4-dehydrorhamnose reductase
MRPSTLVTGGGGLLGGELRKHLPEADFPSSSEFDITDLAGMRRYVADRPPTAILHAAAFTSPPRAEREPMAVLDLNIVGTANVARLAIELGAYLLYVSTDYVFRGDTGGYREDDAVHPVNRYAWSKLGGECAVRLYDRSLIVRTTFGPPVFQYPKAFTDQWTSRESVVDIAAKLVPLFERRVTGVVHVGGPRRTVYDYAKSLDPQREIGRISIDEVDFPVPRDTSLNCERYERLTSPRDDDSSS